MFGLIIGAFHVNFFKFLFVQILLVIQISVTANKVECVEFFKKLGSENMAMHSGNGK